MAKEKENPPEKESLIIKFEHLNPALQQIIGEPGTRSVLAYILEGKLSTIGDQRKARASYETLGLLNLLAVLGLVSSKRKIGIGPKLMGTGVITAAVGRLGAARAIQKKHKVLVESMKEFGILQTKFEGNYLKDWINPTTVARTHPTFFVNYKGDLVFPKMTRTEYARYVFQKRFPGKLGLNPWRWRAYLEPPKAPKKVRDWAVEKAAEWAAAMKRPKLKPALGLAKARAKASRPEKAEGKRRRRI